METIIDWMCGGVMLAVVLNILSGFLNRGKNKPKFIELRLARGVIIFFAFVIGVFAMLHLMQAVDRFWFPIVASCCIIVWQLWDAVYKIIKCNRVEKLQDNGLAN